MSERTRNLLHRNKLEDFKQWCISQGLSIKDPVGEYEALRICHEESNWIIGIVYSRLTGDHLTTFGKSTELVKAYLRDRSAE